MVSISSKSNIKSRVQKHWIEHKLWKNFSPSQSTYSKIKKFLQMEFSKNLGSNYVNYFNEKTNKSAQKK